MSTNYNLERSLVAKVIMQDMFKVKAGESVAITADSGNDPELMNAFAAAVYAVGGKPLLMWTPKAGKDGQAGIKDWPEEALTAALSNVDVWLECNSTILLYSDIWENAFKNNKKLRYLIIADSSVQSLLRTFTGYNVPDLSKMLNKVRDMVLDCKTIRITSDNGTDVSYDINLDYSFDIDDGDFSMPKFGTAPGYVNIVPKVGSMNGTIVFDLLMNANVYGTDNKLEFIMKDGAISDVKGTAKEAENFKEYLASFNDPNMYKISHNMIGLNPSIRKMRGEIVEDERVWGGVDFGFGHTSPMDMPPLGQVAKSHFDGIVGKVSIYLDDIQIVENGIYTHPALKPLAVKLIGGLLMLKEEAQIADDYSRTKVPEDKTVNGIRIASIIIGIGVTLPVFFVGSEVTQALGLEKAIWVFMGVCIVLSLLCSVTAIIGSRTRLSTYMLLHFSFGKKGALLINLLVAITLLGWYAVTVEIFGQALTDAFSQLLNISFPVPIGILLGSVLMTLTSIYGFRIIERFSSVAVPLMLLLVVYVLYATTTQNSMVTLFQIAGNGSMTTTQAISAVVGMVILTPVLMPDYSRFAKTDKDSLISILGLTIGFPLVLLAGGIPSLVTGEIDIMKIMIGLSLTIPALFILIFSTWTTNTANLYSTQLTLSTVFTKTKEAKLGLLASIVGTLLALFGVAIHFIDFLNVSSIFIPPVSAIFIADFFFVKKQHYEVERFSELPVFGASALISWVAACIVAYLGAFDYITFTSISFFDSFIVAFASYLILKKTLN